jgi:hypothetical protein
MMKMFEICPKEVSMATTLQDSGGRWLKFEARHDG